VLHPHPKDLVGIVVESTYNWYWLVDALMEEGYPVHLANPSAIQKYSGLKHADDQHDAFWLAELLRLGILPEGYIYPKEERPIRDLLRKRGHLVRLRTSLIISLQNIVIRNCGLGLKVNDVKRLKEDRVSPLLEDNEDLALAGRVSKETIDFLTRQIRAIEWVVERKVQLKESYRYLLTMPGIGKILALTIMLETGPISRFAKVGNYVSYCRKVASHWESNGKAKGKGNKKNGNKYLAWAFSEAAELARRFDATARAYYDRKKQKSNFMIAHAALAHKLARAAYYILRDQVPFMPEKLFA
jgi:transposase